MKSVGQFTKIGETIKSSGQHVDLITKSLPKPDNKLYSQAVVFNTGGGGIGKIIQSTALLDSIREKYPKKDLHVITPHTTVYQSIPGIKQVWKSGTPNLYNVLSEMYNKHTWLQAEPYNNVDYIAGRKHLIHTWNDMLDLNPLESISPVLKLTQNEIQQGIDVVRRQSKPVVLIQITGGGVKYAKDSNGKEIAALTPMFYRNMDPRIMQDVVNSLTNKYAFIQVAKRGQPLLRNVTHMVDADIRLIFATIKAAQTIVCIDSFIQHVCAAFNKPAVVLWGATRPHCLGYDIHNNLYRKACSTPLCNRPNSYLCDTGPDNKPWICPEGAPCLAHDQKHIIQAIKEQG